MEMKKTSNIIGRTCGNITCIGNYRYFLVCKCNVCNHQFDIPINSWGGVKNCPICREARGSFDPKRYAKYNKILAASKRLDIPLDEEWSTREKFDKWYYAQYKDNAMRLKIDKTATVIGPKTVTFKPM